MTRLKTIKLMSAAAVTAFGISLLSATPAMALPCDDLGGSWSGWETDHAKPNSGVWDFNFRRQTCTSNLWNGYWWRGLSKYQFGGFAIGKSGASVSFARPNVGGGTCSYTGTYYNRDLTNGRPYRISGTYSCTSGASGRWGASLG